MSAPRYPFELVESHRLKSGRQVLARHLLERLMAIATQRGLERFEGDVLEENQGMVGLALDLGFEVHEHSSEPGVLVATRELAKTRPAHAPVARDHIRLPMAVL